MRVINMFVSVLILLLAFSVQGVTCQYPPFGYVSVPPNVLIILDNSGSMYELAYKRDKHYNKNKLYYGYFDPHSNYSYTRNNGGYFYKDPNGKWSGNFLNWLTMRRVDIMRKVLVGGDFYKSGNYYYLRAIDDPDRDFYRPGINYVIAGGYLFKGDISTLPPSYKLEFYGINWKRHYVYFLDFYSGYWIIWKFYHAYRLHIRTSKKPEGVIQKTWDKVRYGLMTFNNWGDGFEDGYSDSKDGGEVRIFISGPGENDDLVKEIQSIKPRTWTPLAETYYEAVRYFEAKESAYNNVNYSKYDPIKYRCQKNFVLLITDGESTKDKDVPGGCWGADVSDPEFSIEPWMKKISDIENEKLYCKNANSMDGTYYLAGVAFYAHGTDLRPDLKGKQNLTLYDVFVFDNSPVGKKLLRLAAKYGGFNDINGNNIPDQKVEWDSNGDGIPDNYFEAQDGYKIEKAIEKAIEEIIKRASGTSAAVLPETKKKGTFVSQSLFYPRKSVGQRDLTWIGYLYNWWFLNTKKVQNIREDTNQNAVLDILNDRIIEWEVEPDTYSLKIITYKSNPNGTKGTPAGTYSSFDDLHPIWEGGKELLYTSPDSRHIFTNVGNKLIAFNRANLPEFKQYLGDLSGISCLNNNPENLVAFIRGVQISGCRNITYDSDGNTWKLGDIVYSTPVLVSYNNMNVVFVGANDGMLHAFKVGYLEKQGDNMHPVKLQDGPNSSTHYTVGSELWAFIPKNVLPYLRYLANPDYCHRYFVDLTPYVVDLDDNNDGKPDRKILIGGMRLGGACGCRGQNCENPPSDTCPDPGSNSCVGLSSYFALDITDPMSPKLLWEFTSPDLGYTFSGPAVIRKKSTDGKVKYYVVFGSGPTSTSGEVSQSLKYFVLDLDTGEVVRKIDTSIQNAFSGRLFTEGFDFNNDGFTDYIFVGYAAENTSNWQGGVLELDVTSNDVNNWKVVKVFSTENPVTAKVQVFKCFNRYYIYFGTGKWFTRNDDPNSDTPDKLYGLPLECTEMNCRVITTFSSSSEICTTGKPEAWVVSLNLGEGDYLKERSVTDPTETSQNIVAFTTIEPSSDPCSFGGRSRMWILNCATGDSLTRICQKYNVNNVYGTFFLQLSGADLHTIVVKLTKNENNVKSILPKKGYRATSWFTGIAPESATPFIGPYTALEGTLLLWLEM